MTLWGLLGEASGFVFLSVINTFSVLKLDSDI